MTGAQIDFGQLSVKADEALTEQSRSLDANLYGASTKSGSAFLDSQPVIGKCGDPIAYWQDALGKDVRSVAKEILLSYGFTGPELDYKADHWVETLQDHTKDLIRYGQAEDPAFASKAAALLDRHREITFVRSNPSLNEDPTVRTERVDRLDSFFKDSVFPFAVDFRFVDTLEYGTVTIAKAATDLAGKTFGYELGINLQDVSAPAIDYPVTEDGEVTGLRFGTGGASPSGRLARGKTCPSFEELLALIEQARDFSPSTVTSEPPAEFNFRLFAKT